MMKQFELPSDKSDDTYEAIETSDLKQSTNQLQNETPDRKTPLVTESP
jgi:hypothetical protein